MFVLLGTAAMQHWMSWASEWPTTARSEVFVVWLTLITSWWWCSKYMNMFVFIFVLLIVLLMIQMCDTNGCRLCCGWTDHWHTRWAGLFGRREKSHESGHWFLGGESDSWIAGIFLMIIIIIVLLVRNEWQQILRSLILCSSIWLDYELPEIICLQQIVF